MENSEDVLFHQANKPMHKSVVTMAAIHDSGFELIEPLYLTDFHLFLKWKKDMSIKHYASDGDVISAVGAFLHHWRLQHKWDPGTLWQRCEKRIMFDNNQQTTLST